MKEEYELLYQKNKKILNVVTLIKIILFVLFLVFFITYFTSKNLTNLYLSLAFLVVFIAFIIYTNKYYLDKKYLDNILLSYAKHEARKKNNTVNQKGFFDKGTEFKRIFSKSSLRDKYLLEDIDVFGKNSLYEHLSSAKSVLGRYKLADSLCHGSREVYQNKENIYNLGKSEDLIPLEASLAFNKVTQDLDSETYVSCLCQKYTPKPKVLYLGLILIEAVLILFIVLACIQLINPLFILIPLIINIFYATLFNDPLNTLNITSLYNSICENQNVLKYLARLDLTKLNPKYQKEYFLTSYKKLLKLSRLWQVLSYKKNIIFKVIFNGILGFEGFFQLLFNKFLLKEEELKEVLDDIANLELIASYANLVYDYDATIGEEGSKLEFIDLSNILVKDCVSNSFTLTKGTIITGSNMSGKTTFLRTIGEAILLFNACGLVPAASFKSPHYMMYTALRVKDDLAAGISSFYAEIEKIREMVTDTTKFKKLALIDEIFKGTNTLDRVYGAKMLIKKLESLGYDFIISTHDFELCEIPTIINYHFAEQYTMDYKEISFDYKIKEGKSVSTNAIFLLKKSGIID